MASSNPNSPSKKNKRRSLLEQFPNLNITSLSISSSFASKIGTTYCLKGSFSKGWPPSFRAQVQVPGAAKSTLRNFTLSMSDGYRFYPDQWRTNPALGDEPADLSVSFQATQQLMIEIASMLKNWEDSGDEMEAVMFDEMARAVYGSNSIDRVGLGLDETLRICIAIFQGAEDLEYTDRSDEYQAKLDKYTGKDVVGSNAAIRNRREVVQHAAAFQYLINAFVKEDQPMTEQLIKSTHHILTNSLNPADSGNYNYKSFGGTYRIGKDVQNAMKAVVASLQADIAEVEKTGMIDPFMLAAKYCDRFVNIHPFKDGNGRMCRLILNAILVKYAGVIVVLGEKGGERDEYLQIAVESIKVGGHPGQLGGKVLDIARGTLWRMKATLERRMQEKKKF